MADLRIQHGNPTPAEVAALVVALTPTAAGTDTGGTAGSAVPAWSRAAILEGVSGAIVRSPVDLTGPRPGS